MKMGSALERRIDLVGQVRCSSADDWQMFNPGEGRLSGGPLCRGGKLSVWLRFANPWT
jgi:hypothetical protein